jgi:hypothetical protein
LIRNYSSREDRPALEYQTRELSFRAGTEFPGRTVSTFLIRNSARGDSLSADLKRWLAGSFSDPKLWPPAEAGRPECYTLNLVRKSETWPARSLYSILTQLVAWFLVESTPAEHGRCASPVRTCLVGRAASLRTRFRASPVRTYFVPRHHFSSPSTYRFLNYYNSTTATAPLKKKRPTPQPTGNRATSPNHHLQTTTGHHRTPPKTGPKTG